MTPEHLELLAHRAGCKLPRVMPRKKRDESVCLAVLFTTPSGRRDVEVPLTASDEDALALLKGVMG